MKSLLSLLCLAITWTALSLNSAAADEKWVVYYDGEAPAETFFDYDLVVLDSTNHPPLGQLLDRNKTVLGYISLGEAENYRHDFNELKAQKLFLMESDLWPGHFLIDVRRPEWTKRVVEEYMPTILHQGFKGIMIDTLDSPLYLEEQNPVKYRGMKEAVVNMVKTIRMHYPDILIMVNRGFPALPELAPYIDMVMAESIYAEFDFKKKTAKHFPDSIYKEYLDIIARSQKISPKLKAYSLDYWDMKDTAGVKAIYDAQRKNGLIPYVSTIDLGQVYAEPQ